MARPDNHCFLEAMSDVTPITAQNRHPVKTQPSLSPGQDYRKLKAQYTEKDIASGLSLVLQQRLSPDDWLMFKRNGIQEGVYRNLRLGNYPSQAVLNISDKRPDQALVEVRNFIDSCQQHDLRSTLIHFGRGKNGAELKSYLAQWLPALASVQAAHTCQKHHGGLAAVYVQIQKSERKRLENRERHAARLGS